LNGFSIDSVEPWFLEFQMENVCSDIFDFLSNEIVAEILPLKYSGQANPKPALPIMKNGSVFVGFGWSNIIKVDGKIKRSAELPEPLFRLQPISSLICCLVFKMMDSFMNLVNYVFAVINICLKHFRLFC
jgi:hypothetical protein